MRLLFVIPYVPTPIRVRPYSLLKTLVDRGHRLTLATLWSTEAERAHLAVWAEKGVRILAARLSRARSLRNCVAALPAQTPLQAVYCRHPDLTRMLDAALKWEHFDAIHVEHLRGAHYGLALKEWGAPVIWDSVDCISHLFEQAVVHSRSSFGRWISRLELKRTRHYERWLLDQFQTTLVTSAVDKAALLRLTNSNPPKPETARRIVVLPNGVDLGYFSPHGRARGSASSREADTLIFSGKMSYHANVTMALHLVQDIMPHIWAARPGVKVLIVGQKPPPAVQKLGQDPRVIVTGYVPDMRPYLQRATVAVVPSVYGAGIQNKVLEAMACGAPVVATTRAATALALTPERDILLANDAPTFACQVLRLLTEPDLRQTIGLNGHNYVKQNHDWSQIGVALEAIYQATTETAN